MQQKAAADTAKEEGEDYMTDDTTEARREQFLRTLTDIANANMALMDGTTAPVEKLIREHDLVFGVWKDDTFPGGVDVYTIKGRHKLAECGVAGITLTASTTAIPCTEREQAIAAAQYRGWLFPSWTGPAPA
jgi:hypothetical protein